MNKNLVLVVMSFLFINIINGQTNDKVQVMSNITCECISNTPQKDWDKNPDKKFKDCIDAAVLGGLLSMINLDEMTEKDSLSIEIGSNKVTNVNEGIGEITGDDIEQTKKDLEKNCDRYKNLVSNNQLQQKASELSCECITTINVSLPLAEKNKMIQKCISESLSSEINKDGISLTENKIEALKENMQKELVESCEAVKRVVFSDNEEKLHAYSNNEKAMKYYNLGLEASRNEDLKTAIKHYKKAVSIDKEFVFAWDNLGVSYRRLSEFDNAIEAYESSLKIDGYNRTALMNIAVVYNHKKDFDNAIKYYELLKSYYPEDPESPYGLSLIFMQLGELEKSLLNTIKAYDLYKKSDSPYQADAERLITFLFSEFKKNGKEKEFKKICKENNLKLDFD
ncbi:MAG: tetratricopeptide repeat protein [Flavobacteriaceae bacterium]